MSKPTSSEITKRRVTEISPEARIDLKKAKNIVDVNMDELLEKFETMLSRKLDEKLENVASKEDIQHFQEDLNALRKENEILNEEVKKLKDKVEYLEKGQRRSNVVVDGLKGGRTEDIRIEFQKICREILSVDVNIGFVRKINKSGSKCLVELPSPVDVDAVLRNGKNLKNTNIFVKKDYTKNERNQCYNLRKIKHIISTREKNSKVSGTALYVGDRKYNWSSDGDIIAANEDDCAFLENLLKSTRSEDNYNIVIRKNALNTIQ